MVVSHEVMSNTSRGHKITYADEFSRDFQESGAGGVFAVAAREQLRGRGTKGRAWIGLPGNVFLTVAIPLDKVPVPLSLIPLRVGTLIAPGG